MEREIRKFFACGGLKWRKTYQKSFKFDQFRSKSRPKGAKKIGVKKFSFRENKKINTVWDIWLQNHDKVCSYVSTGTVIQQPLTKIIPHYRRVPFKDLKKLQKSIKIRILMLRKGYVHFRRDLETPDSGKMWNKYFCVSFGKYLQIFFLRLRRKCWIFMS